MHDISSLRVKWLWIWFYSSYNKINFLWVSFLLVWRCDPTLVMASSFLMFLDHTQRRITVGRTPLDEWSARRRDLYPTTHNTNNRQILKSHYTKEIRNAVSSQADVQYFHFSCCETSEFTRKETSHVLLNCTVENNMTCCAASCSFERARHHCDLVVKRTALNETWGAIQGDAEGKINAFGGKNTGHCKQFLYDHV